MQQAVGALQSKPCTEEDEDDVFGRLIAKMMKRFPEDGTTKDEVKVEIQNLILRRKREVESNSVF